MMLIRLRFQKVEQLTVSRQQAHLCLLIISNAAWGGNYTQEKTATVNTPAIKAGTREIHPDNYDIGERGGNCNTAEQ